jgi:hypothetical protein
VVSSIVSTLQFILTPDIVGKLATACGLERSMAQTATAAALSTILSAFTNLVDRREGANQLAKAVAAQPADILRSISSDLTANNLTRSAYMAVRGTDLLASLLGGRALGTLAAILAQFAGVGEGSSRSLMGLLTPLILGVIGCEQRAAGLNANGLAKLLAGQRKEIVAAMPSGLSQLLEASQLREDLAWQGSCEAANTANYARAVRRRVTWPYWVLTLVALACLAGLVLASV